MDCHFYQLPVEVYFDKNGILTKAKFPIYMGLPVAPLINLDLSILA